MATAAGGVHSARVRTAPSDVQLVAGRVRVRQRRGRAHAAAAPLTTADSPAVLFLQRLNVPCPATARPPPFFGLCVFPASIDLIVTDCIFYLFFAVRFFFFAMISHLPSLL